MLALMPIPTTTHSPPAPASARMPTIFFPSTRTSLGHFTRAGSPVASRMARAVATAAERAIRGTRSTGIPGRRITESQMPPRGEGQCLERDERERPVAEPRVRDDEIRGVHLQPTVEQDVDIDRARSPPDRPHPAQPRLDIQAP